MQTITNEAYLRRRARIVWLLSVGGVAIMVVGAVLYYRGSSSITRPLVLILGGLVTGNVGLALGRRWLRRPRADEVLQKALSELGRQYRLYNYTPIAPHLLISPAGIHVLTVQRQYGRITYDGRRWRRGGHWMPSLLELNFDPLGNPTKRAMRETARVQEFLARELPGQEVPVHSLIVFTHPRADVQATDPPVPVTHARDLKNVLREMMRERPTSLRARQRRQVEKLLNDLAR